MTPTRRTFLATSGAAITLMPFTFGAARAAGHAGDVFQTPLGDISISPVAHASFVLQTRDHVIYVDPTGDADLYAAFPPADLILITHEHGDHFDPALLESILTPGAFITCNPGVYDVLTDTQKVQTNTMANGDTNSMQEMRIEAIPAYNTTEGRLNFHPQGRDNGYILELGLSGDTFRIYISGDTEDTPEMRALENVDIAFVCMNLPFTMDATAAASAVSEFAPTYVYPYHYRGRDNGTQDPMEFAGLLTSATEAKMGGWYS